MQVFLLMAACADSSVPMSLVARVLGVRPDINSAILESVRNCALLAFPQMTPDKSVVNEVESVTVYRGTKDVFSELLLNDKSMSNCNFVYICNCSSLPSKMRVYSGLLW